MPIFCPASSNIVPGGAANVAVNIATLGAKCTIIGLIGRDQEGKALSASLSKYSNIQSCLVETKSVTTCKTRFISSAQHIMRLDRDTSHDIPFEIESAIADEIDKNISTHDALVISDYAKGVLTTRILNHAISRAKKEKIPIVVDPKNQNLGVYAGATLVTPNSLEAEVYTGVKITDDNAAEQSASIMQSKHALDNVLITRGIEGMTLLASNAQPIHIRPLSVQVFDVVGAGDTVISTLACMLASGFTLEQSAIVSNISASLAVSKPDTSTVSIDEIINSMNRGTQDSTSEPPSSIVDRLDDFIEYIDKQKAQGKVIGFTNGVFDILHTGHIQLINYAKDYCDLLIVGINSDSSVKLLNKGSERPLNSETDRAQLLISLAKVDYALIFKEATPIEIIKLIKPDVLIKGSDYDMTTVVGADLVMSYGGKVLLAPLEEHKSTTGLVQKYLIQNQVLLRSDQQLPSSLTIATILAYISNTY